MAGVISGLSWCCKYDISIDHVSVKEPWKDLIDGYLKKHLDACPFYIPKSKKKKNPGNKITINCQFAYAVFHNF